MTIKRTRAPIHLQPAHYIFAGVLLIRLFVLARLTASPFLLPAHGDMHFYDEWARRIVAGQLGDHLAFYGLPGYAYLLAGLYKLCGYGPFVPGLLQALLDAATAVLLYKISVRIFAGTNARGAQIVGALAAFGWAFFVPAQTYAAVLMPTAWLIFVFWFIIWRVVREANAPTKLSAAVFGLLIGVAATGIATILFLLPLLVGAIWLKPISASDGKFRARLAALALLFLSLFAGTAPCWIHNYFVAHDRVFLSAHSGINFWIGNNPVATGYPRFPPGLRAGQTAMLQDSIDVAEAAAGHPLKRGEVSSYWSQKAVAYIQQHPFDWLRLLAVKLRNCWNAFQYDDLSIITSLREDGVTFPGLYFGLVVALALPAIVLAWKTAPLSRWVVSAIALHMLALTPVFTTERYRLPIVPGLLIFAAFGLVALWQNLAANNFKPALSYTALLFASTLFVSWPQRDSSLWALDAYNSGLQALESGEIASARKKLDLAYAYSPLNAEINFAQGNLQLATGNTTAAKGFYRTALQLDPRHSGVFNNLGVLALKESRWDLAAKFFKHALTQSPNDAKIYYLLAQAHLKSGDCASARVDISEAIQLDPGRPEFHTFQQQIQIR